MKRASFLFVLICLALFSFGQVYGQSAAISLSSVTGLSPTTTDKIECGQAVTFFMRLENTTANAFAGSANGFRVYSPDGATWTPSFYVDTQIVLFPPPATTTLTTIFYGRWLNSGLPAGINSWKGPDPQVYDGGLFINAFSADGMGADTVGFSGFNQTVGVGLYASFVADPAFQVKIASTNCADTGLTICIDSSYYPPAGKWLWADGVQVEPDWDGPHCYTIFKTPNLAPVIDGASIGATVNFNHCLVATVNMTATDTEGDYPLVWTTNVGTLQNSNGNGTAIQLVFTAPAGSKAGCTTVTVTAEDTFGQTDSYMFDLCWTNQAPTITGCNDTTKVGRGNSALNDVNGGDPDACDVAGLTYSINTVSPAPVGTYSINSNGTVTFNTDVADAPTDQVFTFNVCVSDGNLQTCCDVFFDVLAVEPFTLQIEKTHTTIQGTHETVDVTLETGSLEIGGFDILIAYDASALNFVKAIPGPHFYNPANHPTDPGCQWEYFTYRFSAFGNCGSICPSGKLRVTGIAESNNGPAHPVCFDYSVGEVLFSLDFLVTDDRTLECSYVPVRFCWFDCGDNTLSSVTGDSLFISRFVYEYDLGGEITNNNDAWGYPTYAGAQDVDCFVDPVKRPTRFIDFFNGGVDIACAESLDARGDVNLNEIANEIADAVLFSRYFIYGLGVFTINMQGQIAATDVNADGLALSVADLVYQIRIIVGDANPFPKLNPVEINYTINNGTIAVDQKVGAAFVEVDGMSDVVALSNMTTEYAYDAESNTTRILVYSMNEGATIEGDFLRVTGNVLNIEMATYEGTPVVANKLPTDFALNQNYPNPFNPSTIISFNLPVRSDVSLTIHNVTGQKVADFSGTYDAGVQEVTFDASQFASGIYFYKLTTENFSSTKRMVLVK
jgi:hypothetical protein